MCFALWPVIFVIMVISVAYSEALRGVQVSVPRAVRAGHSVTMACNYDLEDTPLYSIKWYHDNEEFYRYVPKEEPPTRVFDLPGIHVDETVSNAREVTLVEVSRSISGLYQCEVSADAPLFHTAIESAQMTVVELPDGVPVVTVDRMRFAQGGPLIADCVAPRSSPAVNLTWFVNDQRVPGSTATSIQKHPDSLETATSRLELSGVGSGVVPGPVRLRCEATLFKIYRGNSVELEVRPDNTPQPASVLSHSSSDAARIVLARCRCWWLFVFCFYSVLPTFSTITIISATHLILMLIQNS